MVELALILGLAILGQLLARLVRAPAILLLLLLGMAAGGWMGWIDPDELFGPLLFDGVDLAVAVILFEGGLLLDFKELGEGVSATVRRLLVGGVAMTWAGGGIAGWWLLDMSVPVAAVFGAILTVSGPTVVLPLLRYIKVTETVDSILKWEGVFIDPVGATLAVLVYETVLAGEGGLGPGTIVEVGWTLLVGVAVGIAAAVVLVVVLHWEHVDEALEALVPLAAVVVAFVVADRLRHEAGLMAAIVLGVALANQRRVEISRVLRFKETLGLLLTSVLFIVLAARLDLAAMGDLVWPVAGVVAVLVLVVRPLGVLVIAAGSELRGGERGFVGWMAPRGIVAAATASVFGSGLTDLGLDGAELLVPATFLVILGTVAVYGLTGRPVASLFGVRQQPQSALEQTPDQAGAMTREATQARRREDGQDAPAEGTRARDPEGTAADRPPDADETGPDRSGTDGG